mmetsp:Transcript_31435/g.89740  ORF Transcript_31435/g.89740 Transcript_31435/m.89740 type:complete len:308 (+) Transcript_31435:91-1014(+)
MPAALCPRRHFALGLEAAAALGLLATAAAAAPHFDCRPGAVAFETVHLPGRNVVLLRQGPGCPVLAPKPPTTSGSPQASEDAAEAALVDDAAEDAVLSPASALHAGSARAHTAGLRRAPVLTSGAAIAGVLATMVLLAAISRAVWDRNVRQPRLLAQKAAADEAERARLASEEAERRAREEELEQMARAEAESRAREEAEQKARAEAAALAQRLLEEQEKALEAAEAAPVSARSTKSGGSAGNKCKYDDHRRAYKLAREEEERRSQQEKDDVHRKGQGAAEAPPEKKGWCAPCGCSSGKAAAEPGRR